MSTRQDVTRNIQVKFNQYNMKYQEKLTMPWHPPKI